MGICGEYSGNWNRNEGMGTRNEGMGIRNGNEERRNGMHELVKKICNIAYY